MNQNYKFKTLTIAKQGQEMKTIKKDPNTLTVFEVGETKTIDFEQGDGTRQNFSYAHYITAWMGKEEEAKVIKVFFATHLVTIKGYCLEHIYDALTGLSLKYLKANDMRYLKTVEDGELFVTDIEIKWKKETEKLN